jgi:nicotinate-nucleotide adenylyltransferase
VARIGLLGGTFNPPHIGHLVCAQEAWAQLGLDRVLLLPVHSPPHKETDRDPGVDHRVAMCEAATAGDEHLEVSRAEADVPGRSYTVDTLNRLHEARPEDQLTFIVGGDMAAFLPQWRDPRAILELCSLGVAARDGVGREQVLERLDRELPGASERISFFDMPRIDVSSTLVRRRIAAGRPVRYLVPDAVSTYIDREGLYR